MQAKLVVVSGDAKPSEVDLKLPTTIGRGREATLTVPHPLVSRLHCELFENEGKLFVRDLGSLNGTFIADERITEAWLPPGELLTVGSVTFRAVYDLADDDTTHFNISTGDETVADLSKRTVGEGWRAAQAEAETNSASGGVETAENAPSEATDATDADNLALDGDNTATEPNQEDDTADPEGNLPPG
ncbi:MAG: FHA domain-containing protein [Pirellulaceae bacterium]|jgi:pSer/pThr/pTyr-binding forkhead associated (FHA) protein|nr:FHA domain-containing protein [Pirellulaceae bacterium]MDP7018133.1 FHA domain-containing protein [Pirellulaceae bacterium]